MNNPHPDSFVESIAQRVAELLRQQGPVPQRLFSVEQAAEYLGRTPKAVRHLINSGTLEPIRIDGRVSFDIKDLNLLIERSKN